MKNILASLLLMMMISCNKVTVIEEVATRYDDNRKKVCFHYEVSKDGSKTKVKEIWYYAEGMKHLEGPIVNDKRHGSFKTYHKSGVVMSAGDFVDGVRDGEAVTYHENGKVKYEGRYKNGKECGIWRFYDEDGKLLKEIDKDPQ